MRALRLIFATALVLLALLLIAAQLLPADEGEVPMHPLQHAVLCTFALCLLFTAFYYSRPRAHWHAQLRCPHCHESNALALSTLRRPGFRPGAHFAGGLLGALLLSHARKRSYLCGACQTPCDLRTLGGWVALAWLLFLVLAVLAELYISEAT
jgi:hypothetical protein